MSKSNFKAPEVILPDFSDDDATTTTTTVTKSRRVSFGTNFIKEFIVGSAVSAKCVSEYEMAFSSSDSSAINSSHSIVENSKLNQHTFLVDEDHKSQKPFPLNVAPPPSLDHSNQENIAKFSKFSRTICFNSDSPTADMEFTGGCINLAKSILEKKNKEMTLIISSKTVTPKEDNQSREETKFFDGSQLDMNTTHCFKTRREPAKYLSERKFDGEKTKTFDDTDNEMSITRCSRLFGMNKMPDASAIFDDTDLSSDDSFKENKMPLNMIMQQLDNDGSDLENSLFNPQKSFSDVLNSGSLNVSTESEKFCDNESMDITIEMNPNSSGMPTQMNKSNSEVEDSPTLNGNLNGFRTEKPTENELNSSDQDMECDSSITESQPIEPSSQLTGGDIMSARDEFSPNTSKLSRSEEDVDRDMEMDSFISQEQLIAVEKTMAMEMTIYTEEPMNFDHEKTLEVLNPKESEQEIAIHSLTKEKLPNEELLAKTKEIETSTLSQNEMQSMDSDGRMILEVSNSNDSKQEIDIPLMTKKDLEPNEQPLEITKEVKAAALDQSEMQATNFDKKKFVEKPDSKEPEQEISINSLSKEDLLNQELLSNTKEVESSSLGQNEIQPVDFDKVPDSKDPERDISIHSVSIELPNEQYSEITNAVETSSLGKDDIRPIDFDYNKMLEVPHSEYSQEEIAFHAMTTKELPNGKPSGNDKVVKPLSLGQNEIQPANFDQEKALEVPTSKDPEREIAIHSPIKEDLPNKQHSEFTKVVEASSSGQNEMHSMDFKHDNVLEMATCKEIEQEIAIESVVKEVFTNEENQRNTKQTSKLDQNEMQPMDLHYKRTLGVPYSKNSEISIQSMTKEDLPSEENIEGTKEMETSTLGSNEMQQKNEANIITLEESHPAKKLKLNFVEEDQEKKERIVESKDPPLVDQKVLMNLKSQSAEPGSLWSVGDVKYGGTEAEWSFKFSLLESHVVIRMQLKVLEDDYSQVKSIEVLQVEEAKLRRVEYRPTFEFGVKQLIKQAEQEKKIIKSMLNVSYFMDQMNSFGSKLNRYLKQIYSILTLYPGSRLSDSVLSFRLFSFPILFSTTVFVNLFDLYQLSKSSLSFKSDFGTLDEYKITAIFENCLAEESPLQEFVIRSTGYIIEMERKTGRISKRSHIGLLPRHFQSM